MRAISSARDYRLFGKYHRYFETHFTALKLLTVLGNFCKIFAESNCVKQAVVFVIKKNIIVQLYRAILTDVG